LRTFTGQTRTVLGAELKNRHAQNAFRTLACYHCDRRGSGRIESAGSIGPADRGRNFSGRSDAGAGEPAASDYLRYRSPAIDRPDRFDPPAAPARAAAPAPPHPAAATRAVATPPVAAPPVTAPELATPAVATPPAAAPAEAPALTIDQRIAEKLHDMFGGRVD